MRHGISDAVVHYLADLGMAEEAYRSIVAAVLKDVDHPVAIGYVASLLADAQHRAEQAGGLLLGRGFGLTAGKAMRRAPIGVCRPHPSPRCGLFGATRTSLTGCKSMRSPTAPAM